MESLIISPLPVNNTKNTSEHRSYDGAGAIESVHYFGMVIRTVAFLLGTTGNGLVIWIAGFKMKKTVNVVWFLNLAIADFIFMLFLPLRIAYTALGFHWPFGKFMCKFNSAITYLNMFASIFTLTVISLDRYVCVMFPVWAQNHRTLCLASIISIFIWSIPFCFSSTYFIFRDTKHEKNGQILCPINCHETFRLSIQSIFERAFMEDTQQTDLKNKSKSTPDSMVV